MSFEEALDVPEPKSPASTSATASPSRAACAAVAAPITPPPITSRSNDVRSSASRAARPGQSGFVHAFRPARVDDLDAGERRVSGRSSRAATISPSAVVSRIVRAVPVARAGPR